MSDDLIAPLFTHDEPGVRLTVADVAKLLAEPGVTADYAAGQVRRWAKERIIQTRGKKGGGPTAHNLFALSDVGVAKILSILNETAAMTSSDILHSVALDLYSWREGEGPQPRPALSPIWAALAGVSSGEWWAFRLVILQSDQTGEREVQAHVFRAPPEGTTPDIVSRRGPDYLPRLTTSIHLNLPFARMMADRTKAN